jgi:hypothetical protein
MHAGLTVVTLGLWGISWLAILIGRRVWPWRCRQCGWNAPDMKQSQSAGDGEKPTLSKAGETDAA